MRLNAPAGALRLPANRPGTAVQARRQQNHSRQSRALAGRGLITALVFLMLVGAGVLFGSKTVFMPSRGKAVGVAAQQHRGGWIVHELPDGNNCRYHRFDNFTGWVGAGAEADCEDFRTRRPPPASAFSWGGN